MKHELAKTCQNYMSIYKFIKTTLKAKISYNHLDLTWNVYKISMLKIVGNSQRLAPFQKVYVSHVVYLNKKTD